jgi:tRNA-2-methylthio-N6-dimethylallyladenosine synthase
MSVPVEHNLEMNKTFYIETYGCQMNENDSEIISSILQKSSFTQSSDISTADVILLNTCAIRESAEEKIIHKLQHLKGIKSRNPDVVIGILGCMAERMKEKLLDKSKCVDIIMGPDAYRDLPNMINAIRTTNNTAINVQLSLEETYADIIPIRKSGTKAFLSIMRGSTILNKGVTTCAVSVLYHLQEEEKDQGTLIH